MAMSGVVAALIQMVSRIFRKVMDLSLFLDINISMNLFYL